MNAQLTVLSPGRINVIGDHIDYCGGYVLPAAIGQHLKLQISKNNKSNNALIVSDNMNDRVEFALEDQKVFIGWKNLVYGLTTLLNQQQPNCLEGFECEISGNLPPGSGLSSSASLTCGLAYGLNELFNIGLSKKDIVLLAQQAEQEYMHTECGIMDQFAIMEGLVDQLILLNCQTMEAKPIQADFGDYTLVLMNTNAHHNNAESEYNDRKRDADHVMDTIQHRHPGYTALAHVPKKVLSSVQNEITENQYKQASYIIEENQRVLDAVLALHKNDLTKFGQLMFDSHQGLSQKYRVSCDELDFLVQFALSEDSIIGARMMGGGFGGCTINLIKSNDVDNILVKAQDAYEQKFGKKMTPIFVEIGAGVSVV